MRVDDTPLVKMLQAEDMRRNARRNLLDFARYVMPEYVVGPPHRIMAEKLEAVARGEITRLMVFIPPQTGKSTLVSKLFPVWCLGHRPDLHLTQASYAHSLAAKHSRESRTMFGSPEFAALFPGVRPTGRTAGQQNERGAAHEWETTGGGGYYAAGVRGGTTGRPSDIYIIDDPVKDREEAESPTIQQRNWDWYRSVVYTRRPQAIILVMTRWAPQDLAGRLLDEQAKGGDVWDVVSIPAIDITGASFYPARYPLAELEQTARVVGEHDWNALYQQAPVLRGGNRFQRVPDVDVTTDFPDNLHYVRAWDLASTAKERNANDPDSTAGVKLALARDGTDPVPHLWVRDCIAFQAEAPERDAIIVSTARRDGSGVRVGVETAGAAYKDTYVAIKRALSGLATVKKVLAKTDMGIRAAPLEPIFEAGNVHVYPGPWVSEWQREFMEFPAGAHDDRVAATVGGYEMAKKLGGGVGTVERARLGI